MKLGLPVEPPLPPMEALLTDTLPAGQGWRYEPKWDGFRCIAFRNGDRVYLQSKSCKPLGRYFPEVEQAVLALRPRCFVIDAELVLPIDGRPSFEDLQLRLHPAASRIERLSREIPAQLIVFDLLAADARTSLLDRPFSERRRRLERFAEAFGLGSRVQLSAMTLEAHTAKRWLEASRNGIDGVMAKRVECPYLSGERRGMQKVKVHRTADCVVAGFRYGSGKDVVGALLLGLYEGELLHYVGFTSSLKGPERKRLTAELEKLAAKRAAANGFTGRAPGPSRWSQGKEAEWVALPPEIVVEVEYDQMSGTRFRHGTHLLRRRPDKSAQQCTFEQLEATAANPRRPSAFRLHGSSS